MTPDTLGRRLATARTDAGLSQHEAARRAGMAQPALSRLEHAGRGEWPKLETLMRLAKVYGTTVEKLLEEHNGNHTRSK